MTRKQALANVKAFAAAGNLAACTRIFIEGRLSRAAYDQAVEDGRKLGAFVVKRDAAK